MTRIGFIGLGNQGAPMARRICDAGLPLTVWARRPEASASFAGKANVADKAAGVGAASDVVGICVVADDDVVDVVLGRSGVMAGMKRGGIIAVHSTINPKTLDRLKEKGSPRGIAVVDAPVTGGAGKADAGQLVILAGGHAYDVMRCRPMFDCYASEVFHLGALGAGQTAKLINNLAVTAHLGIAQELFDFAQRMGVDRAAMASVLGAGSGGSTAAAFLAASDFDLGEMWERSRRLLGKDLEIVLDLADEAEAAPPWTTVDAALSYLDERSNELHATTSATQVSVSVDGRQSNSTEGSST